MFAYDQSTVCGMHFLLYTSRVSFHQRLVPPPFIIRAQLCIMLCRVYMQQYIIISWCDHDHYSQVQYKYRLHGIFIAPQSLVVMIHSQERILKWIEVYYC